MVSFAVIAYQLVIFVAILVSGRFGVKWLAIVSLMACLWTVTHIFMPWLMLMQFGTIILAVIFTLANLSKSKLDEYIRRSEKDEDRNFVIELVLLFRRVPSGVWPVIVGSVAYCYIFWPAIKLVWGAIEWIGSHALGLAVEMGLDIQQRFMIFWQLFSR